MCREFWYRYPPAKLLAACPTVVLLGVKRGIEHCRLAAGPVCQKPSEHHRKRFRSPVWNEQCAAISFGSSEKSVGEFARVGANFISSCRAVWPRSRNNRSSDEWPSAYLTAFQPNRANRKHGAVGSTPNNGHSANRDQTEKNTGYEKRRSWDAGNIAENTVNKGSGEPGAGIPAKVTHKFPGRGFHLRASLLLSWDFLTAGLHRSQHLIDSAKTWGDSTLRNIIQSLGQLGINTSALRRGVFVIGAWQFRQDGNDTAGNAKLHQLSDFQAGLTLDFCRHGEAGFILDGLRS